MSEILLATINAKWIHPSLALRLLKTNLGELKDKCEIIEFNLRQKTREIADAINKKNPVILGISVSIWNHLTTIELLKTINLNDDNYAGAKPVIVLGGPEVSFLPENAEIFNYADYVIRGEGETKFRELCENILSLKTEALNAKANTVFIHGVTEDPAALKYAYDLYTDEDLSRKLIYVESSRGCPFACEFCLSSARLPGEASATVRYFPTETFLTEIDKLIKRGARKFKFLDRTFNLDIPRACAILDFFLERLTGGMDCAPGLCVHFELIPGNAPPELRERFTRFPAGSLRLEIGIQTLNPATAEAVHRVSYDDELELPRFLREKTRAIVHVDLIAALPGEDYDSFALGFDRLWSVVAPGGISQGGAQGDVEIQLGILKLLPGTKLAAAADKYGIKFSPEAPYEAAETAVLPRERLDRIKNFARFWELIVNRGKYGDFCKQFLSADSLSKGGSVFARFMRLADYLSARFGRFWGIDARELKNALDSFSTDYTEYQPNTTGVDL